jgi:hypothetical protein
MINSSLRIDPGRVSTDELGRRGAPDDRFSIRYLLGVSKFTVTILAADAMILFSRNLGRVQERAPHLLESTDERFLF